MRKWPILLAFAIILIIPVSFARPLSEWKIDVTINDDKTAGWIITLVYNQPVNRSDYFIFSPISDLSVYADDRPVRCSVSEKVGTSIICDSINSSKSVQYKFVAYNEISQIKDLNRFSYRFSITQLTDKFSLTVRLPLGAALVEKSKLEGTGMIRFEPAWGREGSDGRIIYMEWLATDPKLGDTYDVSLIYEKIISPSSDSIFIIALAVIIILSVSVIIYMFIKRRSPKNILPILTDGERKVVEIVLRDKEVDQRKIVKETDFSKAKVSRIIHDLVGRGVVEKRQKGRTNIIKLKKLEKTQKQET
jgi:hypothetical protein